MANYTDLLADIVDWSVRPDLTAQAPSFVRIAESEIGRTVKVLEMETDVTITVSSPTYAAALPTGFLGFKHLFNSGATRPDMTYVSPDLFHRLDNLPASAETRYTVESNQIKVDAATGATSSLSIDATYYKRFDALASVSTNDLLTAHYDLYLFASLKALWMFVGSTEDEAKYSAYFDRVVSQIVTLETSRRRPSGPIISRPPAAGVF